MRTIYQDETIVVVDKPSGLLSVPGRGPEKVDSVSHRIRQQFPTAPAHPEVHRLDMDTSGLLVLALTAEAQRHLSMQFQNRETEKIYHALLERPLPTELGTAGLIELPFRLDIDNRPYQIYDEVHGKMGLTHWRALPSSEKSHPLIEFTPVTGRTHQLRVHAAHRKGLDTPIIGDPLYGTGTGPGQLKLHASVLTITHPVSLERLTFKSTAPFLP